MIELNGHRTTGAGGRCERPANLLGESAAMLELFRLIARAGPTDNPILIQGESGTGKELVARALHKASRRADRSLVVVNCAALPETLLESELFGHERGSFTGATAAKPGLFEVADGGTLFVDEIGELAGSLQAKLLRVLEDGTFRRLGSVSDRRADVRLLTATNRRLDAEVKAGRFREDLYYRIDVLRLDLPSLRDRRDDIPILARYFSGREWRIEPQAMQALEAYDWPGNVRELINAIERAKILADDNVIRVANLPAPIAQRRANACERPPEDLNLESLRRMHVMRVLSREGGNKSRTARALGVSRRSLYRLLEKYEPAAG
jgi:transcriptional regulator with PAS, ATPase and Fis domain